MNILSWNYKGLGNPHPGVVLSHSLREKALKVLFLRETKQMVDEMKKIQADLRYDNMLAIPCIHRDSGLAMLFFLWMIASFFARPLGRNANISFNYKVV